MGETNESNSASAPMLRKELRRPFLSNVFLSWIDPFVRLGYKKALDEQDLGSLPKSQQAVSVANDLSSFWEQYKRYTDPFENTLCTPPSLTKSLALLYAPRLVLIALLRAIALVITLGLPFVMIPQVLQYVNPQPDGPKLFVESGVAIAFILCALQLVLSLCSNGVQMLGLDLTVEATAVLTDALYEKTLRLSHKARLQFPAGHIITLINADVTKVATYSNFINPMWTAPVHIIVCCVLLGKLLGQVVWVSIGLFAIFIGLQTPLGAGFGKAVGGYMKSMDARIKLLREFLYGVKVIKYAACEDYFFKKISAARKIQNKSFRLFCTVIFWLSSVKQLQQVLVPVITFVVFAAVGGDMSGSAPFSVLGLFSTLATPFSDITDVVANLSQFLVSMRRIQSLLLAEEVEPSHLTGRLEKVKNIDDAITLQNACFCWESSKNSESEADAKPPSTFQLRDMSINIPRASLTAIVGAVGAGKSSFFSALVGDMRRTDGEANAYGTMAYCPQEPWIITGTIKENILFNSNVTDERLSNAFSVCQLNRDLQLLSHGVDTQIGEKGVNLSGGQKARVALARAVYRDADIYLLDDPIAALDAHVSKEVFEKTICGALRGKTVLLATHQLHLLPEVDHIIVLEHGRIVQAGTFPNLMSDKNGLLAQMMKDFHVAEVTAYEDAEENDDVIETKDELNTAPATTPSSKAQGIVAEERKKGQVTGATIVSYFKAGGGIPFAFNVICSTILLIVASSAVLLSLSWWSTNRFGWTSWQYIGFYAGVGVFSSAMSMCMSGAIAYGGYKAGRAFHRLAMNGLLQAPMSFFESQPVGRIISRLTTDVKDVDLNFPNTFIDLFATGTNVISTLIVIVYANLLLLVLLAVLAFLYFLLFRYYQSSFRELKRLQSIMRSPLSAHVSETLNGLSTIMAYKVHDKFIANQRSRTDQSNLSTLFYNATRLWFLLRLEILSTSVVLVLVLVAPLKITDSSTMAVSLTSAISLGSVLIQFFINLGRGEAMFNAIERLNYYANELPREAPSELDSDPKGSTWPSAGAIAFKSLQLGYESRPDHLVIKHLDLSIRPGEKIGIIGRTGSGKSTLVTALFRIIEASDGLIEIDGRDIASVGLRTLRKGLQMIPQEPTLFSGTFRSNLDLESRYTDEQMWQALDLIGLKTYISSLPEKLDAPLTEGGSNLSVGQRQLLCLAKAILANAKVLVMDEATAAVDADADKRIQQSIATTFKDTTVISIAHRLNTIAGFDRVLVLDEGKAVECDAPWTLLERKGSVFAELVEATGSANATAVREISHAAFQQLGSKR
ncbi:uncharacterized protein SPPG_05362 [Spizellomyces punctatus DAOM BR117]|uniref:P-loop containing nucleoside triphosphate hydrolase protein n=1 Tax=Spizellomyces punctatus (strain DAOM BR117) TaxID=645134 RepID=A0A0L0HG26_SPIPD|nr:uncharacterized protein SPPG_05362 [Spizellomyces punctatus DAOM BR117]KNC99986.1 hypothetical protein SPPG_05362 [Spizellomyces punctatus DAOM BR117]|eukprot:XP_016608026.1 hypothetical protein SPPG_05362 [Spizellomyces punctatus DAOM BR117]